MKAASVVGVLVGVLALILALVALGMTPEGTEGVKSEIGALKKEMVGMSSRLDDLGTRLGEVTGRVSRIERAVAAARQPAGLDEDKVRELVRNEVRAQSQRGRGDQGPQNMRATIGERLGLNEEKAEKVAEILQKMGEGIRDIWRENRGGDREKIGELMRELQKKAEEEVAKFLTPEEMEKYREMSNRFGGGRGGRGRGRRGGEEGREERGPDRKEGDAGGDAF